MAFKLPGYQTHDFGDLYPTNQGLGSWRDLIVINGVIITRLLREKTIYTRRGSRIEEAKFYHVPALATFSPSPSLKIQTS
jgi:hypothetical protein